MNELIQAWTRAGNAIAAYYEKAGNPLLSVPAPAVDPAPEPKKRKKAETRGLDNVPGEPETQRPAAPQAPFDPMMDMGELPTNVAPTAHEVAAMTEAESTLKAQEANKALVKAFPTKAGDGMPEGFHKAKAILNEFGVARTTDLVHVQRVQYIAKIDALIAARPA